MTRPQTDTDSSEEPVVSILTPGNSFTYLDKNNAHFLIFT